MTTYTGTVRADTARVLPLLGGIHESPTAVIGEYVENSGDAQATKIYVVFEVTGDIEVVDNGYGMLPDMSRDDFIHFQMYQEDLALGKVTPGYDIKGQLSPFSRRSFRMLMESVGHSGKIPTEGEILRGKRAIGALGFRSIAESVVWYSRANAEMAEFFWGDAPEAKLRPVFTVEPPSVSALAQYQMSYKVSDPLPPDSLKDPYGHVLQSGTKVVISHFREGVAASLRPGTLAEYLRSRFGNDVANKRYELEIIDRVTEEGKRTRGGRRIPILPAVIKGVPLVLKTIWLPGGNASFKVEFYLDAKAARGARPTLRYKGEDKRPLTDIPELDHFPWNTGKIVGPSEFPDVPEGLAPWTTDKRMPLHSPIFNHWVRRIEELEPEIEAAIREVEQRTREQRVQKLATSVGVAAQAALNDLEVYQDLTVGTPPSETKRKKKKSKKPLVDVTVAVLNEHNRGVPDVPVELRTRRNVVVGQPLPTDSYGKVGFGVGFGVLEAGIYKVVPLLPEGMEFRNSEETEQLFNISSSSPGAHLVFHIKTGQPRPEERKIPKFLIYAFRWSAVGEPYSLRRMERGILEVNTAYPDLRRALDEGNESLQGILMAQIVSAALTHFALKGDPAYLFAHQTELFARIYDNLK